MLSIFSSAQYGHSSIFSCEESVQIFCLLYFFKISFFRAVLSSQQIWKVEISHMPPTSPLPRNSTSQQSGTLSTSPSRLGHLLQSMNLHITVTQSLQCTSGFTFGVVQSTGLGLAQSLLPPQAASGWPIGLAPIFGRWPAPGAQRASDLSALLPQEPRRPPHCRWRPQGLPGRHLQVQPGGGHQRGWWPLRSSSTLTRGGGEFLFVIVETFTTFSEKDTGPGAAGLFWQEGVMWLVLSLWKCSSDSLFYPIFISIQQLLVL